MNTTDQNLDNTEETAANADPNVPTEQPGGEEQIAEAQNTQAQNTQAQSAEPTQKEADVKQPEFNQLNDTGTARHDTSLERFYDVEVMISAELGRVSMPIGEVVKLGEGSVIDLDRPVTSPVEVVAQGVRIATGEVVVVDDRFAIRIKEIESSEPDT